MSTAAWKLSAELWKTTTPGTVVDSLGVGLPNARVYVRGSGTETETDAEGRFELDHLGAGTYALHFTHPYLEQLWYEPEPVEVEVKPDVASVAEVRFEAPSMSDVLSQVCGRDGPPGVPLIAASGKAVWRTGILTVTDMDGHPVEDATLHFLTRAYEPRLFAEVRDPSTFNFEDQRSRRTEKAAHPASTERAGCPSTLRPNWWCSARTRMSIRTPWTHR